MVIFFSTILIQHYFILTFFGFLPIAIAIGDEAPPPSHESWYDAPVLSDIRELWHASILNYIFLKLSRRNKTNSPKNQPLAYRNHNNIGVIKKISLREVCTTDLTDATQKTASE